MGIAATPGSHTPKIAFVAAPADYTASDGKAVRGEDINLLARIFSMGPLHHAMTGTGAVAIATAVAIPARCPRKSPARATMAGYASATPRARSRSAPKPKRSTGSGWSAKP